MDLKIAVIRYRKGPEINTRQAPNVSKNWSWRVYETSQWPVTLANLNIQVQEDVNGNSIRYSHTVGSFLCRNI